MAVSGTTASSRPKSGEDFPPGFGLDTVAVSLPCLVPPPALAGERLQFDSVDPATGEVRDGFEATDVGLGRGFYRVRVCQRPGSGWRVDLECSVPKVRNGQNNAPASLRDLHEVLHDSARRLRVDHEVLVAEQHAWLRRLDLVRDFHGVPEPHLVLQALRDVPPDRRDITMASYTEDWNRTVRVTDVVRHTTTYRARLYDKAAESRRSPQSAPSGQVRFELQLRGTALGPGRSVAGLNARTAVTRLDHMFRRLRFDRPFTAHGAGDPELGDLWARWSPDQRRQAPMAIGLRALYTNGLIPVQDPKTRRKYAPVIAELDALERRDAGLALHHLDLDTGTLASTNTAASGAA